jgi:hypothetical protein
MRHAATSGPPPDTRTACTGTGHTALQSELRAQPSGRDGTRQERQLRAGHITRFDARPRARLHPLLRVDASTRGSGVTSRVRPTQRFRVVRFRPAETATRFVKPLSVGRNERTRATAKSNKTKPAVTRKRQPAPQPAPRRSVRVCAYPAVGRWDCISSCPNDADITTHTRPTTTPTHKRAGSRGHEAHVPRGAPTPCTHAREKSQHMK